MTAKRRRRAKTKKVSPAEFLSQLPPEGWPVSSVHPGTFSRQLPEPPPHPPRPSRVPSTNDTGWIRQVELRNRGPVVSLRTKLAQSMREGLDFAQAAQKAGLFVDTLMEWIEQGDKDLRKGLGNTNHAKLFRAVRHARQLYAEEVAHVMVRMSLEQGPKAVLMVLRFLEARSPMYRIGRITSRLADEDVIEGEVGAKQLPVPSPVTPQEFAEAARQELARASTGTKH